MTTSRLHGFYRELLSQIVTVLVEALNIDRITVGAKTWKTDEMGRGLQADLSYYFDPEGISKSPGGPEPEVDGA